MKTDAALLASSLAQTPVVQAVNLSEFPCGLRRSIPPCRGLPPSLRAGGPQAKDIQEEEENGDQVSRSFSSKTKSPCPPLAPRPLPVQADDK